MSSPSSRKRLLFLLPFAPRLDATHGGGRVLAQFVTLLSARHSVALLCLRAPDEPSVDQSLRAQCEIVEEIVRPSNGLLLPQRCLCSMRTLTSLLMGRPRWATFWAVSEYTARLRSLVRLWKPDIVQIEYHVMGQYLSALGSRVGPWAGPRLR